MAVPRDHLPAGRGAPPGTVAQAGLSQGSDALPLGVRPSGQEEFQKMEVKLESESEKCFRKSL